MLRIWPLSFLLLINAGQAQPASEHALRIAANSILNLTNDEVDAILGRMNQIISAKSYPWDVACPTVTFKRIGNLITNDNFLLSGTFQELRANLKALAPTANVMVVSGIDCSGWTAAGCGVVGEEPLIVGQAQGVDAELWLHERGHNVGLQHSAEAPATEANTNPEVARRFMFWRLGPGHTGKTADECSHFTVSAIAPGNGGNGSPAMFATPQLQFAQLTSNDDKSSDILKDAAKVGLTDSAAAVVGFPWVDGIPLKEIRSLNEADVNSIRKLFKEPNRFWPQAVQTLGIVGTADDVQYIRAALDTPVPAIAGDSAGVGNVQQVRILLQTKLAAPKALGILANRTQSSEAVELLTNVADVENAQRLIGQTSANSLSKSALNGLSLANLPSASAFINATVRPEVPLDTSATAPEQTKNVKIAPLGKAEVKAITDSNRYIRSFGLDSILK